MVCHKVCTIMFSDRRDEERRIYQKISVYEFFLCVNLHFLSF